MRRGLLAVAVAALLGGGCLDALEPEVGAPLHARCDGEDSDPGADVSFDADIRQAIFGVDGAGCVNCHTEDGVAPVGLEVGGLDLSSYASLRAGGVISRSDVVIPGDPCASILVQKVGPAPPFGGRMPLNGPPFLSAADQQTIIDWIAEGAQDD